LNNLYKFNNKITNLDSIYIDNNLNLDKNSSINNLPYNKHDVLINLSNNEFKFSLKYSFIGTNFNIEQLGLKKINKTKLSNILYTG
jgi:hypothetical protein